MSAGTRQVEMVVTFTVPAYVSMSVSKIERLRLALAAYATTMSYTEHATVTVNHFGMNQSDLRHLWNEVQLAAPVVHGMAPADPVWGGMTCTEAEAIASIFAAAGRQDVHDFIIDQHSNGDDDPEDLHYKEESNE
jgi:hypothetical protein